MPTPPPGPLPAPLSLVGGLLIAVGGAGDLAYHGALPHELALSMGPLIGADGQRAHLVVFLGMLAILARVLSRAPRRRSPLPIDLSRRRPVAHSLSKRSS